MSFYAFIMKKVYMLYGQVTTLRVTYFIEITILHQNYRKVMENP